MHKYRKEYEESKTELTYEAWLETEMERLESIAVGAMAGLMGFRATYFDVFNQKGIERITKPKLGDLGIVTACSPNEPHIDTIGTLVQYSDQYNPFVIQRLDGTECRWSNAKFVSLGVKISVKKSL